MTTTEHEARSAARARHPSGRWTPPAGALRQRLTRRLAVIGADHPDVAAAALEVRGRSGVDSVRFAAALGIDVDVLAQVESGACDWDELPTTLRLRIWPEPG